MPAFVKDISFDGSHLVVTYDSGAPKQYDFTKSIRVAAVPNLSIASMTLLTKLASLVWLIAMTLVEQGILTEELIEGYDMTLVRETLETDLAVVEGEV